MDLATLHCSPIVGGAPLDRTQVEGHLQRLRGWRFADGRIERLVVLGDFERTMAFVNAVADIARVEDHHPVLVVEFGSCTVSFHTHSIGGVSINDVICAAKVDALIA